MRRNRGIAIVMWNLTCWSCLSCAGAQHARSAEPAAVSVQTAGLEESPSGPAEKLVVQGAVILAVQDVSSAARAIRQRVVSEHGRVVTEDITKTTTGFSGHLTVRLKPERLDAFLEWLGQQGDLESRRIQATDVTKQFLDAELALKNLESTRSRLEELLRQPHVQMKEILEIEKELERVRGQQEQRKGELRYLQDRVAESTLDIDIHPLADAELGSAIGAPKVKLYPGPRFSTLFLLDPGSREDVRFGGGVNLHWSRSCELDFDYFPAVAGDSRSFLVSVGGGIYSDFLGGGRRRFFNPYLALRLGYGYLSSTSRFLVGGEVGVELFKHKMFLLTLFGRVLELAGKRSDATAQASLEALIAF